MDKEFSNTMNEMSRSMGRVEGKLDSMSEELVSIKAQTSATNGRVNKLENGRMLERGVMIGASTVLSTIFSFLSTLWIGRK